MESFSSLLSEMRFSVLLIAAGIVILLISALSARNLLEKTRASLYRRNWMFLLSLIVFFAISYTVIIALIVSGQYFSRLILTGVILFTGALFVYVTVSTSDRTIRELQKITAQYRDSESRYRYLLESANDIIFTLDRNGVIESINGSVRKHLGYQPSEIIGKNIMDYLYKYPDDNYNTVIFAAKMSELVKTGKFVRLIVEFRQKFSLEPKSVTIILELVKIEENLIIMGKGSLPVDDFLLGAFRSEKQTYTFGNYLVNAEYVSQRACRNLLQYIPETEVNKIRIALREVIFNAIEHGNLNISFEEKTKALLADSYQKLISERQNDPRYKIRNATVEYSIDSDEAEFTVTDEGLGFDHSVVESLKDDVVRPHGRGIPIALSVFDSVDFSGKGNRIILKKSLKTL
jgi:two-component system, sensor histidine kinase LadS